MPYVRPGTSFFELDLISPIMHKAFTKKNCKQPNMSMIALIGLFLWEKIHFSAYYINGNKDIHRRYISEKNYTQGHQ